MEVNLFHFARLIPDVNNELPSTSAERSHGTVSELDSVGCQQLLLNSWARARSGRGALDRVLGKGNRCIYHQKSFPLTPFPASKPDFFHAEPRRARRSEDWILSANSASPRETLNSTYSRVWMAKQV